MENNQQQKLLPVVKNYLNITWSDPDTDLRVGIWIQSGISYLDGKRGEPADYMKPGISNTLLLEFCRYMRDSSLDVFENNYRSMILDMHNGRAVTAYVEKTIPEE